jgi:hypothetical protein
MDKDWIRWTRENFVAPLRSLLRPGVGDVKIFIDDQIETGVTWPARLAEALSRSQILIPILSRNYFHSKWCRLELALMCHREKICGLRTSENPTGLILPFIIDDGDCFPPEIQGIQSESIHEFANPFISPKSPRQEEFSEYLRIWSPQLERALYQVPDYNAEWEILAQEQFQNMFHIRATTQSTVPSLSLTPMRRQWQ